jgi:hypothetical protein
MGGELGSGLFVGFAESKTIIEWILFFEINTKDKIIKQMKEDVTEDVDEDNEDNEDSEDQIFLYDYYPDSAQIYKDFDNLNDTLRDLNLMLVCIHNCNDSDFKIGRLITDTNCMESEFQNMKSTYPEDNIKFFGGMIGDFEVRF